MSMEIRGYEATRQRIAEIQARIASLSPRKADLPNFDRLLSSNSRPSISGNVFSARPNSMGSLGSRIAGSTPAGPFDPVAAGLIGAPESGAPDSGDLQALATSIAGEFGLDPKLFHALIRQESGFNPRAVSSAGAMGLTQLMPKTAKSLGVTDPFDPRQNLEGGARYLSQMLKQFGSRELALAAYNAGPGAVKRAGGIPPYPETQNYVRSILSAVGD